MPGARRWTEEEVAAVIAGARTLPGRSTHAVTIKRAELVSDGRMPPATVPMGRASAAPATATRPCLQCRKPVAKPMWRCDRCKADAINQGYAGAWA